MSIDVDKAVATAPFETPGSWDADRVVLYHLGLGAGSTPIDRRELEYVLEDRLKVLPTFGVLMGSAGAAEPLRFPGMEFDPTLMLHGEHTLLLHQPLPPRGTVVHQGRVASIHDKGHAALVTVEVRTALQGGGPLCTNRFGMFLRGAGGFGGDPGPRGTTSPPPPRPPDATFELATLPQQALLYRMSGDKNPIHADPDVAARAGFDRPILHGQCLYGMTCKLVVDRMLGGDVAAIREWSARFAGITYPGEPLTVSCWRGDHTISVRVDAARRGPVLANGLLTLDP